MRKVRRMSMVRGVRLAAPILAAGLALALSFGQGSAQGGYGTNTLPPTPTVALFSSAVTPTPGMAMGSTSPAPITTISFDDVTSAPCGFYEAVALPHMNPIPYASNGVVFTGGGAVLGADPSCANLNLQGYSEPNVLAFSTVIPMEDGSIANLPETVSLPYPVTQLGLIAGGSTGTMLMLTALDANGSPLTSTTATLTRVMQPLSVAAPGIRGFTLTTSTVAYEVGIDDISWTAPQPTMTTAAPMLPAPMAPPMQPTPSMPMVPPTSIALPLSPTSTTP